MVSVCTPIHVSTSGATENSFLHYPGELDASDDFEMIPSVHFESGAALGNADAATDFESAWEVINKSSDYDTDLVAVEELGWWLAGARLQKADAPSLAKFELAVRAGAEADRASWQTIAVGATNEEVCTPKTSRLALVIDGIIKDATPLKALAEELQSLHRQVVAVLMGPELVGSFQDAGLDVIQVPKTSGSIDEALEKCLPDAVLYSSVPGSNIRSAVLRHERRHMVPCVPVGFAPVCASRSVKESPARPSLVYGKSQAPAAAKLMDEFMSLCVDSGKWKSALQKCMSSCC
eukprot:gnl/TRDRNA2_/TRDRNA2_81203_c0_seq1.p1 gnl/TRDRNA2_/TRDRNA2_81203_c0~~gnl/TRDRNA2_/TRDRNA2_81203_c0_seq1.p1  ORF type:complete len:292 (+),score=61.44 gnl/TRDRNA2_/TRDRNA2_81203_c0_seq1:132-1007(+)